MRMLMGLRPTIPKMGRYGTDTSGHNQPTPVQFEKNPERIPKLD